MTGPVIVWLLTLVGVALRCRPLSQRRVDLIERGTSSRSPGVSMLIQRIGYLLRSALGRPRSDIADQRWGRSLLCFAVLVSLSPPLAIAVGVALSCGPVLQARRQAQRHQALLVRELPEAIDLLRLAVASGGTLYLGVRTVGSAVRGPVTQVFANVCDRLDHGMRLVDALDEVGDALGPSGSSLLSALLSSERYGVSISGALDRLAGEARDMRRRQAEVAARKVPVRMLVPLVVCVLPAFVLLTLMPTLAGSFQQLDLGGP